MSFYGKERSFSPLALRLYVITYLAAKKNLSHLYGLQPKICILNKCTLPKITSHFQSSSRKKFS